MRVRAYIPGQRFRFTDLVASMFSHLFVRPFVRCAGVKFQAFRKCQRSRSPGAFFAGFRSPSRRTATRACKSTCMKKVRPPSKLPVS